MEIVPLRRYAASIGKEYLVDYDPSTEEVLIGNLRLDKDAIYGLGGYIDCGTTYLPKHIALLLLS